MNLWLNTDPTPPTTPALPEDVDPQELQQLVDAFTLAYEPGDDAPTLLGCIVASGKLLGVNYKQERRYAEPLLLSGRPVLTFQLA